MVDITTNSNKVAKCLTFRDCGSQICKEGCDRVAVIVVVLKIFAVLGIDTQYSCSISVGAVYREQAKMGVVKATILCPAPST